MLSSVSRRRAPRRGVSSFRRHVPIARPEPSPCVDCGAEFYFADGSARVCDTCLLVRNGFTPRGTRADGTRPTLSRNWDGAILQACTECNGLGRLENLDEHGRCAFCLLPGEPVVVDGATVGKVNGAWFYPRALPGVAVVLRPGRCIEVHEHEQGMPRAYRTVPIDARPGWALGWAVRDEITSTWQWWRTNWDSSD